MRALLREGKPRSLARDRVVAHVREESNARIDQRGVTFWSARKGAAGQREKAQLASAKRRSRSAYEAPASRIERRHFFYRKNVVSRYVKRAPRIERRHFFYRSSIYISAKPQLDAA